MAERRFPPPWLIEDIEAAFVVKDGNGQKLAYVYFEDEPGWRSAAKLLTNEYREVAGSCSAKTKAPRQLTFDLDQCDSQRRLLGAYH